MLLPFFLALVLPFDCSFKNMVYQNALILYETCNILHSNFSLPSPLTLAAERHFSSPISSQMNPYQLLTLSLLHSSPPFPVPGPQDSQLTDCIALDDGPYLERASIWKKSGGAFNSNWATHTHMYIKLGLNFVRMCLSCARGYWQSLGELKRDFTVGGWIYWLFSKPQIDMGER